MKTPVLESLFNKILLKGTPTQVFSCEYCKIFKNTYFEEHLPMAASVWRHKNIEKHLFLGIRMFLPTLFETEYIWISIFRSSRWQMFFKIGALESFANYIGKHLSQSLFLIKLQTWRLVTLLKSDSKTGVFL